MKVEQKGSSFGAQPSKSGFVYGNPPGGVVVAAEFEDLMLFGTRLQTFSGQAEVRHGLNSVTRHDIVVVFFFFFLKKKWSLSQSLFQVPHNPTPNWIVGRCPKP